MPTPCSTARRARSTESAPSGSVSHEKKPPCGRVQCAPVRHRSARARPACARTCAGRARATAPAARRSSRGATDSSKSRCPSAPAHWSVFCLAETSWAEISAGPTAQPSRTPGKNVFDVVPAWTTTSGAEAPEARQRVAVEAELAVGDVLDDQEAVAAARARRAASRRSAGEADAGRVLVVGDACRASFGRSPPASRRSSSSTSSPCSSIGDGDELGLEARGTPGSRRGRSGASTTTTSPGSRNDLPTSSSASIAPLVISSSSSAGPAALQRLEPAGERVERPGEPARRRVLERARLARRGELLRAAPRRARAGTSPGRGSRPRTRSGRACRAAPGRTRSPRRRRPASAPRRAPPTVPSRASPSRRQSYAARLV